MLYEVITRWKWLVIAFSVLLMVVTIPLYFKLGSEFMPPLAEESILYMPTTMPGISITEAQRLLQNVITSYSIHYTKLYDMSITDFS